MPSHQTAFSGYATDLSSTTEISVCPNDCPSTGALSVQVEVGNRIGAVDGNQNKSYTASMICAKVAKYAERIHHPDRLTQRLLHTGPKGGG